MTATHVTLLDKGPQKVIATEKVVSPLPPGVDGEPIYFRQIVKLLLEDGSEVYGCVHCEYVSDSIGSVRPHLGKHSPKGVGRAARNRAAAVRAYQDLDELTLGEILDYAQKGLDVAQSDATIRTRLIEERDEWKARAKAAESQLAKVRNAFKGLAGE